MDVEIPRLIPHLCINKLQRMIVAQNRCAGCHEKREISSEMEEPWREFGVGNVRKAGNPE